MPPYGASLCSRFLDWILIFVFGPNTLTLGWFECMIRWYPTHQRVTKEMPSRWLIEFLHYLRRTHQSVVRAILRRILWIRQQVFNLSKEKTHRKTFICFGQGTCQIKLTYWWSRAAWCKISFDKKDMQKTYPHF